MVVLLSPKGVGDVEGQRLRVLVRSFRLIGERFVESVHQIMRCRIVDIHAQYARHLAGGFPFSAGTRHQQCLKDAIRRVNQVSFFIPNRLVKGQSKSVIGMCELLYGFRICLGVDDVRHSATGIRDFAWFFFNDGFFRLIHWVGFCWALNWHARSKHEGTNDYDVEKDFTCFHFFSYCGLFLFR